MTEPTCPTFAAVLRAYAEFGWWGGRLELCGIPAEDLFAWCPEGWRLLRLEVTGTAEHDAALVVRGHVHVRQHGGACEHVTYLFGHLWQRVRPGVVDFRRLL